MCDLHAAGSQLLLKRAVTQSELYAFLPLRPCWGFGLCVCQEMHWTVGPKNEVLLGRAVKPPPPTLPPEVSFYWRSLGAWEQDMTLSQEDCYKESKPGSTQLWAHPGLDIICWLWSVLLPCHEARGSLLPGMCCDILVLEPLKL